MDKSSDKSDQADAMAIGYQAAALRIEIEIGVPQGPILDIGANIGAGMAYLKTRWPHAELYGIEPVDALARRARAAGLNVVTAWAERLPYRDGFFGLAFSRHSLEHVEDRSAAIREIRRVLRPGGYLYVQAPIAPGSSPNALHVSPYTSHSEMRDSFDGFQEVYWGPQPTVAEFIGQTGSACAPL